MERFQHSASQFATLTPWNKAAFAAFTQVAQKKLKDEHWNKTARQNIEIDDELLEMSTYSDVSESDGGTGPTKTVRPILRGYYAFDFAKPPRHPAEGWLIGGGKFSTSEECPEILLTERKKNDGVSSRHARLAHNFSSGALVITASDGNGVWINGEKLTDDQLVIHGRTTTLEFGRLKYRLQVYRYDSDEEFRDILNSYKHKHAIADDDYPTTLLATPAESDFLTGNYILKNVIGEGATSVVYAAYDRKSGCAVAIKKVLRSANNAKAIKRDIEIAQYIGAHPRICTLIDVIDPAAEDRTRGYETFGLDEVFQVYEPLCNWTIEKLINDGTVLDIKIREEIFWQLLEGIEYLHLIGVMHRDIKPLNMTVVSMNPKDPQARLIDFGLAIQGTESYEYRVGTESYLAPEMLAGWERRSTYAYTNKTDMFAFGLSMYQFFCQQRCSWARIDTDAWGNLTDATFWQIQSRLHESQIPDGFKELIFAFISWDPLNRYSAKEAMEFRAQIQFVNKQNQLGTFSEGNYDAGTGNERDANQKSLENMDNAGLAHASHSPNSQHKSSPAGRSRSWNTDLASKTCLW